MKESLEGTVKWPHVDVATFERFSEYLYTGDFLSPCFEDCDTHPAHRTNASHYLGEINDDPITQTAWVRFQTRQRYIFHELPTVYEVYINSVLETRSMSKAFLSVARVYTFAHYYHIETLMIFCGAKIHKLMILAPGREEVCDLLQLCKDEPAAAGSKELVFEYCALNLRGLLACKRFHTAIEEYPEASLGMIKKMKSFQTFYFNQTSTFEDKDPDGYSLNSEADLYHETAED
ncbi:hypothetical protein BB8028_0003g02880 [Beauveria bassiana]|uniref:BTB domain-containing protein n=1 Tax=Beauveria bassiana TaxID=176275 RepID=A0A2S7Y6K4_BEABA|nr:hypothetical protein BB8028_0003g02880 [Beauveria bassiana]